MCYRYDKIKEVEQQFKMHVPPSKDRDYVLDYLAAAQIVSVVAKVKCGVCFGWCKGESNAYESPRSS